MPAETLSKQKSFSKMWKLRPFALEPLRQSNADSKMAKDTFARSYATVVT